MVVYIQKRLNIFVYMPSGAGAEGGGVGCMVSRQPSLTGRTGPPPYVQFLATSLVGGRLMRWLQLRFGFDSTTIRPRYGRSTTHATTVCYGAAVRSP